jgi:trehalose 6-phosphate phosphatase
MPKANKPPLANKRSEIQSFIARVARASASALLLDYDGTLAPFCDDRQAAFPYPGVTRLLQAMMASGRTRVVMITGRSAREAVQLLGIDPAPEVWGAHGFERLRADGRYDMPPLDAHTSEALAEAGRCLAGLGFLHLTEVKPGGIAVHWRGLPAATAAKVREKVLEKWLSIAQRRSLSLLEFDGGIEIRVPHIDKGTAVRTIIEEMPTDAPIAYLGDDSTDERAFEALSNRGLNILVRPEWRNTRAQLWIKPPDELLDFLAQWRQACCDAEDMNQPAAFFPAADL